MTDKGIPLAERAARGEYDLIEPLDYHIMDNLPVEGTILGGVYEIGETVKVLGKKFPDEITNLVLGGRLRSLEVQGLVRKIRMVKISARNGWQVTHKGKDLLDSWKEGHGSS